MQCGECGLSLASNVQFCPACGARQPAAQPGAPAFAPPILSAKAAVAKPAASKAAGVPSASAKSGLPQPGDTFAQRYRVEKYLGLGSLCNVYLCRDSAAGNREVVLKIMHARKAAESGMPESFLFLAESVARYDHKGIARILESDTHEQAPYYTMEWIPGTPLRMWLMERLNFENRVLPGLGIIRALLDVFEAIHERGCYGCLKPENVFITLNGPVVMDFGVVGFLSPQEFEFNSYARRYIPYMAPELRQDWSNLLPHSDYYSLGALLYEILVGRPPAPQLRLPSELSRIFGIEADEIILKSMAARPLDRFATLEAFKQAVESLQSALLGAQPPEGMEGLPPAQVSGASPSHLDLTNDVQSVHNPNLVFSAPEPKAVFEPPPRSPRFQAQPPFQAPQVQKPWAREPVSESSEGNTAVTGRGFPPDQDGASGDGQPDPGARTAFYPNPAHEEGERTLSSFANLGDRVSEEAHSQRRFTRAPIASLSEGAAASNAIQSAQGWENLAGNPPEDAEWTEPEAEPVPAWLWAVIGVAGLGLVGLSAYFGMTMPR